MKQTCKSSYQEIRVLQKTKDASSDQFWCDSCRFSSWIFLFFNKKFLLHKPVDNALEAVSGLRCRWFGTGFAELQLIFYVFFISHTSKGLCSFFLAEVVFTHSALCFCSKQPKKRLTSPLDMLEPCWSSFETVLLHPVPMKWTPGPAMLAPFSAMAIRTPHPAEIWRSVKMCIKWRCHSSKAGLRRVGKHSCRVSLSARKRFFNGLLLNPSLPHPLRDDHADREYKCFKGTRWVHGHSLTKLNGI